MLRYGTHAIARVSISSLIYSSLSARTGVLLAEVKKYRTSSIVCGKEVAITVFSSLLTG